MAVEFGEGWKVGGVVEVGFFCYWKPYFYSVVWERKWWILYAA